MSYPPEPANRHLIVVALDGPGSSGKSSVGAAAARRLGYGFCDTGLLYRALTWLALHRGLPFDDGPTLAARVEEIQLTRDSNGALAHVLVDGGDVTAAVHTPAVDARVSEVSQLPDVRAALLERQRRIAAAPGIIMAGRDIGSVVLPNADLKLYLDASVEERARRRTAQWGHPPDGAEAADILARLRRRDGVDATRRVAPLTIPDDALIVLTDGVTFDETVDMVEAAIRDAEAAPPADVTATQASAGPAIR